MEKSPLVVLIIVLTSLLFIMPESKADLNDIILDIADSFNVDIYVSSPMDTNAIIYVESPEAWVVFMDDQYIPQENLDLLNALKEMESWTDAEIIRIDNESLELWQTLQEIESQSNQENENTKNWATSKIDEIGDELSDLNKILENRIDELKNSQDEYDAMLANHTKTLVGLYNRTMILRDLFLELKTGYIIFVNETNINISKLQDKVRILNINVSNLEENIEALKEYIKNLEEDLGRFEAILMSIGVGGGLIVVGFFFYFSNRRHPIGEIMRNGNGFFKNGRQYKIRDFIPREQTKADKIAERQAKIEAKHKQKNLAKANRSKSRNARIRRMRIKRNPDKSPLLLLINTERKKSHSKTHVKQKLEVKNKGRELVKQKRYNKSLAKKKEQAKVDRIAMRKVQLEAKLKQKELTRQKRQGKILAKKKTRELAKATKEAKRKAKLSAKHKERTYNNLTKTIDAELNRVNRLKSKGARIRHMRIKRNPDKSPIRFLFSFLYYNK